MKYLKRFDKKIKGFKQFMSLIKESVDYWNLDDLEDSIEDYLRDLLDEQFKITNFDEGFVDCVNPPKKAEGDPNQLKLFPIDEIEVGDDLIGQVDSYQEKSIYIVAPGLICPAYSVRIEESDESEGNLTNVLSFFRGIVLDEFGLQVGILIDGEAVDFDYIKIEDGQFHVKEYDDDELGYITYDSIDLVLMGTKPVDFTMSKVAEYYGWSDSIPNKDGSISFEMSLEDMADLICSDSTEESSIVDGISSKHDYYPEDYYPDIDTLIWELSDEAENMFALCVIRELGGVSQIDDLEDMTEEEGVKYLASQSGRKKLIDICDGTNVCSELRNIYSDYAMNATEATHYSELFSSFEEEVDKYFEYKYDSEKEIYTILFKEEWFFKLVNGYSYDSDYFRSENIDGIVKEWFERENGKIELSPRYSDSGDVNVNEFSKEAISTMVHYLN